MAFLGTINQQMIDLAEAAGTVIGRSEDSIPVGQCLMFYKGTLMYHGPLSERPKATPGMVVILNPADFDRFDAFIKKRQH